MSYARDARRVAQVWAQRRGKRVGAGKARQGKARQGNLRKALPCLGAGYIYRPTHISVCCLATFTVWSSTHARGSEHWREESLLCLRPLKMEETERLTHGLQARNPSLPQQVRFPRSIGQLDVRCIA